GGQAQVFIGSTSSTSNSFFYPTGNQIPVPTGGYLKYRFGVSRSQYLGDQSHSYIAQFYDSGGGYIEGETLVSNVYAPPTGSAEYFEFVVRVPEGAAYTRLQVT